MAAGGRRCGPGIDRADRPGRAAVRRRGAAQGWLLSPVTPPYGTRWPACAGPGCRSAWVGWRLHWPATCWPGAASPDGGVGGGSLSWRQRFAAVPPRRCERKGKVIATRETGFGGCAPALCPPTTAALPEALSVAFSERGCVRYPPIGAATPITPSLELGAQKRVIWVAAPGTARDADTRSRSALRPVTGASGPQRARQPSGGRRRGARCPSNRASPSTDSCGIPPAPPCHASGVVTRKLSVPSIIPAAPKLSTAETGDATGLVPRSARSGYRRRRRPRWRWPSWWYCQASAGWQHRADDGLLVLVLVPGLRG